MPLPAAYAASTVTVAWDKSPETDVIGYKFHYGTVSKKYQYTVDVKNNTSCSISGLTEGTTYYFAAKAYNKSLIESDYSKELAYTIPDLTLPIDTDGDGILDNDETGVYGTDPLKADTDNDGINDGDELSYWTSNWNVDADNDGIINLLDADSDNDGFMDGLEIKDGYDPSDSDSYPPLPPPTLEIGEIILDHNWIRVIFNKSFKDPVVVAQPLSLNDSDPAVIRMRNIDKTGFDIRVQEWDYLDGVHEKEKISYIAIEQGNFILEDGTLIKAGKFVTDKVGSFGSVKFGHAFQAAPVIITTISSFNETDAVTGRLRNISTENFEYCMQEQELNSKIHQSETIDYIAWEPSSGTVAGLPFEVGKSGDVMNDGVQSLSFIQAYQATPVFLADIQSAGGMDTANVRWQNKDTNAVDLQIYEEQSKNDETGHTTEIIGYMAIASPNSDEDSDSDGLRNIDELYIYETDPNIADTDKDGLNDGEELDHWGSNWNLDYDSDDIKNILDADSDGDSFSDGFEVSNGYDPADPASKPNSSLPLFEIGEIQLDHNWTQVNLTETFADPIVIAKPMSFNGDHPAVIRIRSVDSSGFAIRIQEWDYLDGSHTNETVSYLVMEKGNFTLDDGTQIEAGRFNTNKTGRFGEFNFSQDFQDPPVVLAGVSSFNESDSVTGRLRNISNQGFEFCMQEQELNPKEHLTETVDYIAWPSSKGSLNGYTFEISKTADKVKDSFFGIEFEQSFASVPHFLGRYANC